MFGAGKLPENRFEWRHYAVRISHAESSRPISGLVSCRLHERIFQAFDSVARCRTAGEPVSRAYFKNFLEEKA